jgi:hypothetical protein
MDTSKLNRGDRVECKVKGISFAASIVDYDEVTRRWQVKDTEPSVGYSLVTSRQLVKRLGVADA